MLSRLFLIALVFGAAVLREAFAGLQDEEDPKSIIKEMDKDGDGLLSFEEVHAGVESKFADGDENEKAEFDKQVVPALKEIFPKVDADGDGKLKEKEVANLMKLFD